MSNNSIFLCIVLLAFATGLTSCREIDDSNGKGRKISIELFGVSTEMNKDETISSLQRLLAALNTKSLENTSKILELEAKNSEYAKQLKNYENTNCTRFHNSTEFYMVHVPGIEPFPAPCESQVDDGGWTVIQRRLDGTVSFERSWNEYRNGFGNLKGEFFIGLEKLHKMTTVKPHELLIVYESQFYETDQAKFISFAIGSEEEEYLLKSALLYSGYNTKSLKHIVGEKFSTFDRDNDKYAWRNCADEFKGGWWFGACDKDANVSNGNSIINLNGPYVPINNWGISYAGIASLKSVKMLIRPQI